MKHGFRTTDLEKIGVKRERYKAWRTAGHLPEPYIQKPGGHGIPAILSRWDVYTVALMKRLSESGIPIPMAGQYATALCEAYRNDVDSPNWKRYNWLAVPRRKVGVDIDAGLKPIGITFGKTAKAALKKLEKQIGEKKIQDIFLLHFSNLWVEVDKVLNEIPLKR